MPPTVRQHTGAPVAAAPAAHSAQTAGTRQGTALLVALLAACCYAAFADGATSAPGETRLQVGLAALALAAVVLLVGARMLRLRAPREALIGAGLLTAFAGWCGLSLLWSVSPDATWVEVNRALAYALVLGLALCAGASAPRAITRVAVGWLLVAGVICLYAFGGKAAPGLHVGGLFDLNHTDQLARLRAPLGYWNALALVLAMAVPTAVRLAIDEARSDRLRLAALFGVFLLLSTMAMTYSRGGILGLATAIGVILVLGQDRIRALIALALAALAAAPVIAIDFGRDSLTVNGAPLAQRIADGRSIIAMTIVMTCALLGTGWWLLRAERRQLLGEEQSRTVTRGLALLAAFYLFASVGGAAQQPGGLGEQISRSWHAFTDVKQDSVYDPSRLATTNSGNRWIWWQEAIGSWSAKPLGGWGAGSFPVVHLQYRENSIPVKQPHNVELQFLTETGLIGFLLVVGAFGFVGVAAVRRVRGMPPGRERELAVALLAGSAAWVVHGAYDWDWDIPGVTLPVLLFLGVLAATPPEAPEDVRARPLFVDPYGGSRDIGVRAFGIGAATLLACGVMASSLLPWLAESKTQDAQADASLEQVTPGGLRAAAAEADVAARLDPLSPDPLFASYAIALQRGRTVEARSYLLEAADRAPNDVRVWQRLATLALSVADRDGARSATLKALSLDPRNPLLRRQAARAVAFGAPPNASATATGTPLPSVQAG